MLCLPSTWADDLPWTPPPEPCEPFDYVTWILAMRSSWWLAALQTDKTHDPPKLLPPWQLPIPPLHPPPDLFPSAFQPYTTCTNFPSFGLPFTLNLYWLAFHPLPSFQRCTLHYQPLSTPTPITLTIPYDTIPSGATAFLCHLAIAFDNTTNPLVCNRTLSNDDLIFLWGCYVARTHDHKSCFQAIVNLAPTLCHDHHPCLDHVSAVNLSRSNLAPRHQQALR